MLNSEDMQLLPGVIKAFETKIGPGNSVPIKIAVAGIRNKHGNKLKKPFTNARFKAIVAHIQKHSLAGIVLGPKGYYVAENIKQLHYQITAMNSEADKLKESSAGLEKIMRNMASRAQVVMKV